MSTLTLRFIGAAAASLALAASSLPAVAQPRPDQSQQDRDQGRGQSQDRDQGRGQVQDRDHVQGRDQGRGQTQDRRPEVNRAGRYRITSTVNLRSGAGTNYRRIGQLRSGRMIEVDQVRAGWLHVRSQGWISAQFARRA